MKSSLLERFLRYTSIETTSHYTSGSYPSTPTQLIFMDMLADELRALGCHEVSRDEWGYLTATIPATAGFENEPAIGFLAHVDTSPDMSGRDVKAIVHPNYDPREPLALGTSGYVLDSAEFEELRPLQGHTLITTDGTTLLGADDKAGVAAIVTAAEYLLANPEIKHGKIRLGFTPDEEVGRGVDHFDVDKFGAAYAYTIDSGALGCLEYENFNAARAVVHATGLNIHPGYAKDKMVNALGIVCHIHAMIPAYQRPETTEGRDGFFHLQKLCGTVESATAEYIIRDHDKEQFERKKELLTRIVATQAHATIEIEDQYYNMYEVLKDHPRVIERAERAMLAAGVEPRVTAIRGGTDGSRLSFMGLPCPNIFTGGGNMHSRYEYASLDEMAKAVEVIANIATVSPAPATR